MQIGFLDHLIVGQAIAGRAGILQLPGNWDALIDEPYWQERFLEISFAYIFPILSHSLTDIADSHVELASIGFRRLGGPFKHGAVL